MKMRFLFFLLIFDCATSTATVAETTLYGQGVLVNANKNIEEGFYAVDLKTGLDFLNPDGSVYSTLYTDAESHEFFMLKNRQAHVPALRSYHPDYHLLIMDASKNKDAGYSVRVDGSWKTLKNDGGLTFKSWRQFLEEDASLVLIKGTSIDIYSSRQGKRIKTIRHDENYSFDIIEMDGDWAYVTCDKDCEGCGDKGEKLAGWMKVKNKNLLLVDLAYLC